MNTLPTMPEHGSERFRQATAAKVLGDLLMVDLPALTWRISPYASEEDLIGTPTVSEDDESRVVLTVWARFLGVEVQAIPITHGTRIEASTVRDGVSILIGDYVDEGADAKGGAR